MNAFITGSRAYGTATPDSDLDLCVLMDQNTLDTLIAEYGWPIRVASLNIIPCTSELEMLAWAKATDQCRDLAASHALTKDMAIDIHVTVRAELGIPERPGFSGKKEDYLD